MLDIRLDAVLLHAAVRHWIEPRVFCITIEGFEGEYYITDELDPGMAGVDSHRWMDIVAGRMTWKVQTRKTG